MTLGVVMELCPMQGTWETPQDSLSLYLNIFFLLCFQHPTREGTWDGHLTGVVYHQLSCGGARETSGVSSFRVTMDPSSGQSSVSLFIHWFSTNSIKCFPCSRHWARL